MIASFRYLKTGLLFFVFLACHQWVTAQQLNKGPWSVEKIKTWYQNHRWLTGANYIPANAINQLEMWQAASFSPEVIDKELALAEQIGFNTLRVYLHSLAWKQDAPGFKKRIDTFLDICQKHKIKPLLVFFDDCWGPKPKLGEQPRPFPGAHNSGWLQDPGWPMSADTSLFPELEKYVTDIMTHFKKDERILAWDLYNEAGNGGKVNKSLPLLKGVFQWARNVAPAQPITAGMFRWHFDSLNNFITANSDFISYHNYMDPEKHLVIAQILKSFGRPVVCTEYMARTRNSRFSNILPMLKNLNIGAINWGFVAGKTNTIYDWDVVVKDGGQPVEWFHDIFKPDLTPYRQDETNLIRKLSTSN